LLKKEKKEPVAVVEVAVDILTTAVAVAVTDGNSKLIIQKRSSFIELFFYAYTEMKNRVSNFEIAFTFIEANSIK
jgi:hypothetical protein